MSWVGQGRKSKGLQTAQNHLDCHWKRVLLNWHTAYDINNPIFYGRINLSCFLRAVDNPKKINIIFRLQIKVVFLICWYLFRNHVDLDQHLVMDTETIIIKMHSAAMFSLNSLNPFHSILPTFIFQPFASIIELFISP